MAIDARIPLMSRGPDLAGATQQAYQTQNLVQRNKLMQIAEKNAVREAEMAEKMAPFQERAMARQMLPYDAASMIQAAQAEQPNLDQIAGIMEQYAPYDPQAAQMAQGIRQVGQMLPNLPEQQRAQALDLIRTNLQSLAEQYPVQGQEQDATAPASVREYEYVQKLRREQGPEAVQEYYRMKRGQRIFDVGGVPHVMDDASGKAYPIDTPEGRATLAGEARAKETLSAAGERGTQSERTAAIGPQAEATAAADRETTAPQRRAAAQESQFQATNALRTIAELRPLVTPMNAGRSGELIARANSESGAAEMRRKIKTLKSREAIEALQALKRASPTGGSGLGATNQAEFSSLETLLVNMDPEAGPQEIKANLDLLEEKYARIDAIARMMEREAAGEVTQEEVADFVQQLNETRRDSIQGAGDGESDDPELDALMTKYLQ